MRIPEYLINIAVGPAIPGGIRYFSGCPAADMAVGKGEVGFTAVPEINAVVCIGGRVKQVRTHIGGCPVADISQPDGLTWLAVVAEFAQIGVPQCDFIIVAVGFQQ